MISAVIGLGCAVALFVLALSLFQNRLLYFPAPAALADLTGAGLTAWPDRQDFRGLQATPDPGTATDLRGTALLFHGNAGHAGHRAFYARWLTSLGFRVILMEYPGYGPREGKVGEASFVTDAVSAITLAHRLHGEPLLVIGESLGAGVAAAAAARAHDKVAALMLITPWDRLENVAAHHYPWLPVKWLLRDRYDSLKSLQGFSRPVLVALAEFDDVVPARFGRALYEGLSEPKALWVVKDAGHNDWAGRVDPAWWHAAMSWLLTAPLPTQAEQLPGRMSAPAPVPAERKR